MDLAVWFETSARWSSSLPVLILYCLSVSTKLRSTQSRTREETHQNPYGSLVSILVCNLGGPLLTHGLVLCRPISGDGCNMSHVLAQDWLVAVVLGCWAVIYFSPSDLAYGFMRTFEPLVSLINGWKRTHDILKAVQDAHKAFPQSLTMCVVLGVLKGWGGSLVFPVEASLRGKKAHNDLVDAPSWGFIFTVWQAILLTGYYSGYYSVLLNKYVSELDVQVWSIILFTLLPYLTPRLFHSTPSVPPKPSPLKRDKKKQ